MWEDSRRALDLQRRAVRLVKKQMRGALDGMAVRLTPLPQTPVFLLLGQLFTGGGAL